MFRRSYFQRGKFSYGSCWLYKEFSTSISSSPRKDNSHKLFYPPSCLKNRSIYVLLHKKLNSFIFSPHTCFSTQIPCPISSNSCIQAKDTLLHWLTYKWTQVFRVNFKAFLKIHTSTYSSLTNQFTHTNIKRTCGCHFQTSNQIVLTYTV